MPDLNAPLTATLLAAPTRGCIADCETRHGLDHDAFHHVAGRLHAFLLDASLRGETVAAWGSSEEACALLCAAAVGPEQVTFTVALGFTAAGRRLPCTNIPVYAPGHLEAGRPEWLIALPGTDPTEVAMRADRIKKWGGQVVALLPRLEVLS